MVADSFEDFNAKYYAEYVRRNPDFFDPSPCPTSKKRPSSSNYYNTYVQSQPIPSFNYPFMNNLGKGYDTFNSFNMGSQFNNNNNFLGSISLNTNLVQPNPFVPVRINKKPDSHTNFDMNFKPELSNLNATNNINNQLMDNDTFYSLSMNYGSNISNANLEPFGINPQFTKSDPFLNLNMNYQPNVHNNFEPFNTSTQYTRNDSFSNLKVGDKFHSSKYSILFNDNNINNNSIPFNHSKKVTKRPTMFIGMPGGEFYDEYIYDGMLGQGAYGSVFRFKLAHKSLHHNSIYSIYPNCLSKSRKVAVKIIENHQDGTIPQNVKTEIKANRKLGIHPNIVCMMEARLVGNSTYLVFELLDCNLSDFILENFDIRIPSFLVQRFMKELLTGLAYIHKKGFVHCDIKSANLLITKDLHLKIADFGLAEECTIANKLGIKLNPYVVSTWYRCPELLLGRQDYNAEVDMWAVGCIFAEFFCKSPLFHQTTDDESIQLKTIFKILGTPKNYNSLYPYRLGKHEMDKVFKNTYTGQSLKDLLPDSEHLALDLVSKLLEFDPKKRLTAEQALKHPYFGNIE